MMKRNAKYAIVAFAAIAVLVLICTAHRKREYVNFHRTDFAASSSAIWSNT